MIQGNNRGKIKQPPAAEVIKYVIEPSISAEEAERSFQNYEIGRASCRERV